MLALPLLAGLSLALCTSVIGAAPAATLPRPQLAEPTHRAAETRPRPLPADTPRPIGQTTRSLSADTPRLSVPGDTPRRAADIDPSTRPDSVYATPALRQLVAEAALRNRQAPATFGAYRVTIETELALIARDSLGREQALEIEQLDTRATWRRDGVYDLRVLGYRAQNRGVPYSTLSVVQGFTVPWLYGDRLNVGVVAVEKRKKKAPPRANKDTLVFVHPFAADRDRYYRFSGGDTVAVIRGDDRQIPVVRVVVRPRSAEKKFGAFEGDIDLDARRGQIVRMRGQFVSVTRGSQGGSALVRVPGVIAVAYVDFTNAEVARRYWLPVTQRTEFQAAIAPLGETRAVFRLVSTFRDYQLSDTTVTPDTGSAQPPRVVFSYSPRDSMDRFAGWRRGLGEATEAVHADDFADLAPDAWRPGGPPRLDAVPHSMYEIFRFNRVEGLYLGASATMRFRDAFPGLEAGAFGGYATAERTIRGGARAALRRLPWLFDARAERGLVSTNDFVLPLSDDPGFTALLGSVDDYDYVDRRLASVSATRVLGSVETALLRAEAGLGRDRGELQRISRGLFGGRNGFHANRGALDGTYIRFAADLDLHPGISGDFPQPGLGARLHVEQGVGQLAWRRAELALSARKYWGPLSLGAHADAGVVGGRIIPPQQLFELGGQGSIPGYAFKQFAGDRAALFRATTTYRLGLFTRPVHALGSLFVPGVAPRLALSAQGGWAELSSPAARLSAQRLDVSGVPVVPRPTEGVRASVAVGVTFFSDLVYVAVARPVDHPAPWRLLAGFGSVF